jgi:hypothetical protein
MIRRNRNAYGHTNGTEGEVRKAREDRTPANKFSLDEQQTPHLPQVLEHNRVIFLRC